MTSVASKFLREFQMDWGESRIYRPMRAYVYVQPGMSIEVGFEIEEDIAYVKIMYRCEVTPAFADWFYWYAIEFAKDLIEGQLYGESAFARYQNELRDFIQARIYDGTIFVIDNVAHVIDR